MPDDTLKIDKGSRIRFKHKRDEFWEVGIVEVIWNCCGELAVDIGTVDGVSITMIPAFGDFIEDINHAR